MRKFPFHLLVLATCGTDEYVVVDSLTKGDERWFLIENRNGRWVGLKAWDDLSKDDVRLPQKMTDLLVMWVMMGGTGEKTGT